MLTSTRSTSEQEMKCEDPYFTVCVAVNSIGIILVVVSLIFTLSNDLLDRCLRKVIISFLLADFVGTFIMVHDTLSLICSEKILVEMPLVRVSVLLSLIHLVLLLSAEYNTLLRQGKYRNHGKYHNYLGLVALAWIISVVFGTMINTEETRTFFGTVMLVVIAFLLLFLFAFLRKYIWRKKFESRYLAFVQPNQVAEQREKELAGQKQIWMLLLCLHVVFFSCFAVAWSIAEILNGSSEKETSTVILLVYSTNFYVPSISCVYLACYKRFSSQRVSPID